VGQVAGLQVVVLVRVQVVVLVRVQVVLRVQVVVVVVVGGPVMLPTFRMGVSLLNRHDL